MFEPYKALPEFLVVQCEPSWKQDQRDKAISPGSFHYKHKLSNFSYFLFQNKNELLKAYELQQFIKKSIYLAWARYT